MSIANIDTYPAKLYSRFVTVNLKIKEKEKKWHYITQSYKLLKVPLYREYFSISHIPLFVLFYYRVLLKSS